MFLTALMQVFKRCDFAQWQ